MHFPKKLKQHDKVAIVATANKVDLKAIQPGVELLKSWGLTPVIGKTIGTGHHQMSGTDEERIKDFQDQLDNPEIKAIWCARGGYGSVRMLDALDFTKFREQPKWIIGYSDISALHAEVNKEGFASIHAEMPALISGKSRESVESLKKILFGEKPAYEWSIHDLNRPGKATGELIGGNLSVVYSLLGSPSVSLPDNKILFLEDLGEYLYHIDRMMQNLKRNGWFENLNGMLIGGMTEMRDNEIPFGKSAEEIIADTVKEFDFSIGFGFPAGHIKDNRALLLGGKVQLEIDAGYSRLEFL